MGGKYKILCILISLVSLQALTLSVDTDSRILIIGGLGKGQDPQLYRIGIEKGKGQRFTLNLRKSAEANFNADISSETLFNDNENLTNLKNSFDIVQLEWAENATSNFNTYSNIIHFLKPDGYLVVDGLNTDFYKSSGGALLNAITREIKDVFMANKKIYNKPLKMDLGAIKISNETSVNIKNFARYLLLMGFKNIELKFGKHPINGREEVWLEAQLITNDINAIMNMPFSLLRKETRDEVIAEFATKDTDEQIKALYDHFNSLINK